MADRGYTKFNPNGDTEYWLRCAQRVIEAYRANWPLTVRQVFYRMVASYDFPKREGDYQRLVRIIAKARRSSLVDDENGISFDSIRDDRGQSREPWEFESPEAYLDYLVAITADFHLERQVGQDHVLEMWCEAAGMVPIMTGIAHPYGMRVSSGGGYDSVTAKHKLAKRAERRWKRAGLRTIVLHVGDFDPSGENLCDVLHEDVLHMVSQLVWEDGRPRDDIFDVERVALTGRQVIDREVITAPPKPTDARMAGFLLRNAWVVDELGTEHITAQLEALTPSELEDLIRDAIEAHLDQDAREELLEREAGIRDHLRSEIRTLLKDAS